MNETLQRWLRSFRNNLIGSWTLLHSDSSLNIPVSRLILVLLALAVIVFPPLRATARESPEDKRVRIRNMASDTLESLYKMEPGAQESVENSVGYAVFDNTGGHLMMPTTIRGGGIAVDSQSKQETYMKIQSDRPREGTGAPDSRMVFVFETRNAFDKFLDEGWEGSNWTDTPPSLATNGDKYSGAFRVEKGIWVYQIIDRGLAFQLTLAGTRYRKDDKLNKK